MPRPRPCPRPRPLPSRWQAWEGLSLRLQLPGCRSRRSAKSSARCRSCGSANIPRNYRTTTARPSRRPISSRNRCPRTPSYSSRCSRYPGAALVETRLRRPWSRDWISTWRKWPGRPPSARCSDRCNWDCDSFGGMCTGDLDARLYRYRRQPSPSCRRPMTNHLRCSFCRLHPRHLLRLPRRR